MDQSMLLVVTIDALLVSLLALIVLLYLSWRKKKRCHRALERFFDDIKAERTLRNRGVIGCLTKEYKLDKKTAEELAEVLFSAEKLFLTQFVDLQMQQSSLEGFYQHLCDLMDSYLYTVPDKLIHVLGKAEPPPPPKAADEQMEVIKKV